MMPETQYMSLRMISICPAIVQLDQEEQGLVEQGWRWLTRALQTPS